MTATEVTQKRNAALEKYLNEIRGILLSAFAQEYSAHGDYAAKGRWMHLQLYEAKKLIVRILDDVLPELPLPVQAATNGKHTTPIPQKVGKP